MDRQGRHTASAVDRLAGRKPRVPLSKFVKEIHDLDIFVDALQEANLTRAGAKRAVHHAIEDELVHGGSMSFSDLKDGLVTAFGRAKKALPHAVRAVQALTAGGYMSGGKWTIGRIWEAFKSGLRELGTGIADGARYLYRNRKAISDGLDKGLAGLDKHKDAVGHYLGTLPKVGSKLESGFHVATKHAADLSDLLKQVRKSDGDRLAEEAMARHPEAIPPHYRDVVVHAPSYSQIQAEHAARALDAPPPYGSGMIIGGRRRGRR